MGLVVLQKKEMEVLCKCNTCEGVQQIKNIAYLIIFIINEEQSAPAISQVRPQKQYKPSIRTKKCKIQANHVDQLTQKTSTRRGSVHLHHRRKGKHHPQQKDQKHARTEPRRLQVLSFDHHQRRLQHQRRERCVRHYEWVAGVQKDQGKAQFQRESSKSFHNEKV